MGTQHLLIAFDRPFSDATIPSNAPKLYTTSDLAAARAAAYREGYDKARAFSDRQLAEFRDEVQALQHGLIQNLPTLEATMLEQLRAGLPALAVDMAQRLFAGFEPPVELVEKLCQQTLDHLYPERENLELIVCPRDAELLEKHMQDLELRYPNLKIRADASLRPGDCQVRSRFGLTDARLNAKLEAVNHELMGSA
jgi:flagellar assembly protein FliH